MSLSIAKLGAEKGNLKEQLLQEERDLKAELEAIEKAKGRASKTEAEKPKKGKKED